MADKSKIEWTDATWNPIVGCSIKSPGCRVCYAMKDAWRKHHNPKLPHYHGLTKKMNGHPVWTGILRQSPEHILTAPLRWREPRMVFVNSMSDLFHENVPDEWIDPVMAVIAMCPQHTMQVLTKRSDRMCAYFNATHSAGNVNAWQVRVCAAIDALVPTRTPRSNAARQRVACAKPLANLWLGVSAERQKEADERIPDLLQTPAAVRFVSLEPLIGPIDLTQCGPAGWFNAVSGYRVGDQRTPSLDWIIVGGESGPDARPMHPQWARDIRDQCAAAGKLDRFFMKQWGQWVTEDQSPEDITLPGESRCHFAKRDSEGEWTAGDQTPFYNVGKGAAGRLLDGTLHNGMPEARTA